METRKKPRYKVNLDVTLGIDKAAKQKFALAVDKTFKVETDDISVLGIGIFSKHFLPKGLRIDLQIDGKPFGLKKIMNIKGEIRYSVYIKTSVYRCGIQFSNLDPEYSEKIAKFITRYERRKAPRLKLSD